MARASGLGSQLIAGLVVILLAAASSIGMISSWAIRRQAVQLQQDHARIVSRALAAAVATGPLSRARLGRWVARLDLGEALARIEVYDARLERIAARGVGASAPGAAVRQVLDGAEPQQRIAGEHLEIVDRIERDGRVIGALRLRMPVAAATSPGQFWLLMGIDSLVLIAFVALVVRRYVARPLRQLEDAAARVAGGDLSVRLGEAQSSRELASLAASFNQMTAALAEQLERLDRQRQAMIRSEKLASVGRLSAGVAHEIGNPLQSIIGFADLLAGGTLDERARADFVGRIQREAERIHHIVRELLDYSRPVDEALEAVELAAVVEQALQLVQPLKQFRALTIDHDEEGLRALPSARGNSGRLVQVVVNLLLNAADALAGLDQACIRLQARAVGDRAELLVSNNGPPIPTAVRERIFDPFYSTKEPGEGTGLGLAVCRSIAEACGGSLTLDDAEETRFVLALPVETAH